MSKIFKATKLNKRETEMIALVCRLARGARQRLLKPTEKADRHEYAALIFEAEFELRGHFDLER